MRIGSISILVLAGTLAGALQAAAAVHVGGAAPQLSGPTVAGERVNLADYHGKWVYVDFWATWCGPCMKALPEVVELSKRTAGRDDLVIMGVSLDDSSTAGRLSSVVSKAGIEYPVLFEGTGKNSLAADNWGVNAIPATFLIDPDGNIAGVDVPPGYVEQVLESSGGTKNPRGLNPDLRPAPPAGLPPSGSRGSAPSFRTKDLLLPDSPSSGDPKVRDLEIRTEISTATPLRKYRVSVLFAEPQGKKGENYRVWRYNIALTDGPSQRMPFLTEIAPAPGKLVGLDSSHLGAAKLPGKVDPAMPPISATYSASDGLHTIIVPVPQAATKLYYSIAAYDEIKQQYIESGLVQVSI